MPMSREEIVARLEGGNRDLSGLDLAGADLSRLDLRGANLSRADLSSADLRWAVLEGADLSSSVLRQADARWAILRGANLRQADLRRANLAWSDLTGADLLGADIDAAILDNATLGDEVGGQRTRAPRLRSPRREGASGSAGAGFSLREASPALLLLLAIGGLLVVQGWGWLYQSFYFDTFFTAGNIPAPPEVVAFFDPANLMVGFVSVVLRALLAAVALPVLLLAFGLVILAFLAIPLGLVYLGERMLGDIIRPAWRPVVVLGLFVAFFAVFIMVFPVAVYANQWVRQQGLPKGPILGDLVQLWQVGGWAARIGLLLVVAAAGYLTWLGWRLLSRAVQTYDVPTQLRLRYPALNDALVRARASRFFQRSDELDERERRRGLLALAGGALLLATLFTGVGIVSAYNDMCDGGRLPRVQLYVDQAPSVPDEEICQRMLATADGQHYVFFPNQTTQRVPEDVTTRVVNLRVVPADDVQVLKASGGANTCASCLNEPGRTTGTEWFIYDPSLVNVAGAVLLVTEPGFFTIQPSDPTMPPGIRLSSATIITVNGLPANADAIQPGGQIAARGNIGDGGAVLDAVTVNVVEGATAVGTPGATARPPATLDVNLADLNTPIISGSGWVPGTQVMLGIGRRADTPPAIRFPFPSGAVTAGADGSFSAPISYQQGMPTGPEFVVVAQAPASAQSATANWLLEPPPTPTLPPTSPPQVTSELPPTSPPTATVAATNTPFPTKVPGFPGGQPPTDCKPDEFEYDSTRPFQKQIYVSFGEGTGVQHNFCPKGDVDLMYFQVKAGRSYKVETKSLANGVDTVMAVGDLSNSTPCMPAGCWNDDAAALTFASRIEFQAVEDDVALVTVSNRGGNNGTEATYQLSVVEYVPTPTPTLTPAPSGTWTATPTATRTPRPAVDSCEVTGGGNDTCARACLGIPREGVYYYGTIGRAGDEDFFIPVTFRPGVYRLTLRPPEDKEYDLVLRYTRPPNNNTCPAVGIQSLGNGAGNPAIIEFTVTSDLEYAIQVAALASGDYDPFNVYSLMLERLRDVPTNTPGPSPIPSETFTPTNTPTNTATMTPPVRPPLITATPTETPTGSALNAKEPGR